MSSNHFDAALAKLQGNPNGPFIYIPEEKRFVAFRDIALPPVRRSADLGQYLRDVLNWFKTGAGHRSQIPNAQAQPSNQVFRAGFEDLSAYDDFTNYGLAAHAGEILRKIHLANTALRRAYFRLAPSTTPNSSAQDQPQSLEDKDNDSDVAEFTDYLRSLSHQERAKIYASVGHKPKQAGTSKQSETETRPRRNGVLTVEQMCNNPATTSLPTSTPTCLLTSRAYKPVPSNPPIITQPNSVSNCQNSQPDISQLGMHVRARFRPWFNPPVYKWQADKSRPALREKSLDANTRPEIPAQGLSLCQGSHEHCASLEPLPTSSKRGHEGDNSRGRPSKRPRPSPQLAKPSHASPGPSSRPLAYSCPPSNKKENIDPVDSLFVYVSADGHTWPCCVYQCPITGGICNTLVRGRDTRSRYRHLATHAQAEEMVLADGHIGVEDAFLLRHLPKTEVSCGIDGCDFRTEVWRTDRVRENHEKTHHRDAYMARVRERREKKKGRQSSFEGEGQGGENR